ncbi:MAG: tetratricopeptide repeat protein [bacterium]|nr:tetratricopeptide repeat protein [bacterium]
MIIALCLLLVAGPAATEPAGAPPEPAKAVEAAYHFARAKLLVEESAFEEAQRAFQRALELDDSEPYCYLELARFHLRLAQLWHAAESRLEHLQSAAGYAEEALRRQPENLDFLRSHAQIQMRLGEHQPAALARAQEAFETLRRMVPGDLQILTSLGQLYLWSNRPGEAAEVLREASSYLPNHRMILTMLVEALLGAGESEEAEIALARLVASDPSSLDHRLKLAQLRSQRADHRGAAEVLREAPEDIRADSRLQQSLARELHLSGDNEAALDTVDHLLEDYPDAGSLRQLRVSILAGLVRYGDAIAELESLISSDGDNPRHLQDLMLLCRLLERVGRSAEAVEKLRSRLAQDSESLELKLTLAGILERRDQAGEAADILAPEIAGASLSELEVLAPALAELLVRAGRGDQAAAVLAAAAERSAADYSELADRLRLRQLLVTAFAEDWPRLVELAPDLLAATDADVRVGAHLLLADALVATDRLGDALELLAAAEGEGDDERRLLAKRVEILSDNDRDQEAQELLRGVTADGGAEDLLFAARSLQRSARWAEVVVLAERLLEQQPESLTALFLLGTAQERNGARASAIAAFRRLLALAPEHAPTLNYLGYMWAEAGENLPEALDMIKRAVAFDPDNGAYVDSLGWTYYQLGRLEQAREALEWAVRLVPDDATILEHLGDLYLKLEELNLARDCYRQAVELDGENLAAVRRKLQTLEEEGL